MNLLPASIDSEALVDILILNCYVGKQKKCQ